jgi:hypothetical protein
MDPITLIATALAAGAALREQDTVLAMVKDAYTGLKVLVRNGYGHPAPSWCSSSMSRPQKPGKCVIHCGAGRDWSG